MDTAPLTIIHVTNNYHPYAGGVVRSIDVATQGLVQAGHTVFIVTLDFTGNHKDPAHVYRVPSLIKGYYRQNAIAFPWQSYHYLDELVTRIKPDIIHSHHPGLLGNTARKIARDHNISCVFTHHTLYEDYAHYIPLPVWLTTRVVRARVRDYCDAVDYIIAPSDAVAKKVSAGTATSVIVIPSAIRSIFFDHDTVLKSIGDNTSVKLLSVSRFRKEKNIIAILDLILMLPQRFCLTLVGYGEEYQALQQYAQNIGITDRIRFVLSPSEHTLLAEYRSAHLFVFPSHTDTQGLVIAEAMASGLPVVALDGPGQQSIIQQGSNGYIVDSVQAMRDCMIGIAQNKSHFKHLQVGARETAQGYHQGTMAKRLEGLYTKLFLRR